MSREETLKLTKTAKALSSELGTPITPGFESLVFKASRGIEEVYQLTYFRKDGSRFPAASRKWVGELSTSLDRIEVGGTGGAAVAE